MAPAHDGALPKDTASPHLTRLGKRVKELREKKGLTQTDLAQASGVSRVYISGIERGAVVGGDLVGAARIADRLIGLPRLYPIVYNNASAPQLS